MLNKIVAGLLLAALAACGSAPPQIISSVQTPPDSLLQDCQHAPRPADNTVNGLMLGIINERNVTESCDWADKAALRAWKAGVEAAAPKAASGAKGN